MAPKDRVTIELYVDDHGTVRLRQARKEVEELGQAGARAFGDSKAAADDFAGALLKKVGIFAMLTAGAYALSHAITAAFTGGIKAADAFEITTIGIGASLTNMAREGQGSFQQMFERNTIFAKEMYEAIRKEDYKRFASADEIMTSYNALVQKGYAVRLDEVSALGLLTDKIKLATAGQNTGIQINQEIRALMEGQARAGSLLAQELKDRIGPGWEEVIDKHRRAGTLLEYLASLWPGLDAASAKVQNTLEAQKTTLEGHLKFIGREGLSGAYEWIVEKAKNLNSWLTEHEKVLAGQIKRAWADIQPLAQSILDIMVAMVTVGGKVAQVVAAIAGGFAKTNEALKQMESQDLWAASRAVASGAGETDLTIAAKQAENIRLAKETEKYKRETYELYLKELGQTATRPKPLEAPGGGKGAENELKRIENLTQGLYQELARLSEGSLGQIEEWANKQVMQIERVKGQAAEVAEALGLVEQVRLLKQERLLEDFNKWHASAIGDQSYAEILGMLRTLDKFAVTEQSKKAILERGNKDEIARMERLEAAKYDIVEASNRKLALIELGRQNDLLSREKQFLDAMGQAAPLERDRAYWKGLALEKELEIGRAQLEQFLVGKNIAGQERERFRQLQDMTDEARRLAFAREQWGREGVGGGLKIWAAERSDKLAREWGDYTKSTLDRAEGWIGDTIGQGIVGALNKEKAQFEKIGKSLAEGFITELAKMLVKKAIFDPLSRLFGEERGQGRGGPGMPGGMGYMPKQPGWRDAGGGALPSYGEGSYKAFDWDEISGRWLEAADANKLAGETVQQAGTTGIQSSLQLGLGALSLGLGALGLTTGSKELMYASMAMTIAATLLQLAATMDMLPFHAGGVVMHAGGQVPLYAHAGLRLLPDERLIVAQTGEGILPRTAMSRLGPGLFEALRRGDFVTAAGGAAGGLGQAGGGDQRFNVNLTMNFQTALTREQCRKSARHMVDAIREQAGRGVRLN
jgi:hypothetical protein